MPRIRYLKPEFFSDEDLAELPFQARLTFAGLWCYADKAGRLEDRPKFLKAMIFPYDNVDMEKQLDMLSNGKHENGMPFIQRYKANGSKLIQIIKWDKHQKPHHTEKESNFPPAPPLMGMEKGMGMGMEKQHEASTELKNGDLHVKERLLEGDFKTFWNLYPLRNGKKVGKKECEDYFRENIKPEDLNQLIIATGNYTNSKTAKDNYAKDPIRFLKKDFWRDWIEPPEAEVPSHLRGLKQWANEIKEDEQNGRER